MEVWLGKVGADKTGTVPMAHAFFQFEVIVEPVEFTGVKRTGDPPADRIFGKRELLIYPNT